MYKIIYSDNSIFLGGNPDDSKWNHIIKPIKNIEYTLLNKIIFLEGFEAYNHLVVRKHLITTGEEMTSDILLLAKKDNKVYRFIFDLRKMMLINDTVDFGKEFRNAPTIGWKEGMILSNPIKRFN